MTGSGETPAAAILVVEDDADIREAVTEILTGAGYTVTGAFNGAQAMEWVRGRPAGAPTLIILDFLMPVMDGRAFLNALANEPAPPSLAVLLFTATSAGINGCLTLPLVRGLLRKPSPAREILRIVATAWPEGARAQDQSLPP